jgi:hypothetical protein
MAKLIFVSYARKDLGGSKRDELRSLAAQVIEHLKGLRGDSDPPVELWLDIDDIRAGDEWQAEIDDALARADLAVLLVSPAFLASRFIMKHELPRLRQRRKENGLRLIPILLEPCAWPSWLSKTDIRPRGNQALSEISSLEAAPLDRKLAEIVAEIREILARPERRASADPSERDHREKAAAELVAATLLSDLDPATRAEVSRRLVGEVRACSGLSEEGVWNAARFFVEYHLLTSEQPTSPLELEASLGADQKRRDAGLVARLKQGGRSGDFSDEPIEVISTFFRRTNDRADRWKAYFEALVREGGSTPGEVASLAPVSVRFGFLSPQYLVAGLLSRFNDDWKPLLDDYQRSLPSSKQRRAAFERLQLSQWNCWLMWGPSIPICRCAQWRGHHALQYGYGDENNSIPVLELASDDKGCPKVLGSVARELAKTRRSAQFASLTGRLRWGPWFLRPATAAAAEEEEIDLASLDRLTRSSGTAVPIAAAQSGLYLGDPPPHRLDSDRPESDGLVMVFESLERTSAETRVYFSAYLWLMFLVAVPPLSADQGKVGPGLLRAKAYPDWPDAAESRTRVRQAKLWEDLLPVFVHANLGDPEALSFQKRALVESAFTLLREVYKQSPGLFDSEDVAAGIQFHLVCSSDYSGCGEELRYPSQDPLLARLRERLAAEPDRDLAERIVLPASDSEHSRPSGLAAYFSACHLPDLLGDYFEHVSQPASG